MTKRKSADPSAGHPADSHATIIPLAIVMDRNRPVEISVHLNIKGATLWRELVGRVMQEGVDIYRRADTAAEVIADLYPPDQIAAWFALGVDYTTYRADGGHLGPVAFAVQQGHGMMYLDLPHVQVLVFSDQATARDTAGWLARALPSVPVRYRGGDAGGWEVVVGVLGS